jgi:hypothetical protein
LVEYPSAGAKGGLKAGPQLAIEVSKADHQVIYFDGRQPVIKIGLDKIYSDAGTSGIGAPALDGDQTDVHRVHDESMLCEPDRILSNAARHVECAPAGQAQLQDKADEQRVRLAHMLARFG